MAGCHSNALYDALRKNCRAAAHKRCERQKHKARRRKKSACVLRTVAAFSLMSANVSASTEVIACLQRDAPSEGSRR